MTTTHITKDQSEARKAEVPETEALKPCPFCGGKCDPEGWIGDKKRSGPACDDCGSAAETVAIWNTRAAELSAQESKPVDSRIVTDSLGFELVVEIHIDPLLQSRGTHTTHTDENGVYVGAPHTIKIRSGLSKAELAEVIAHETYHLFYSVRNLITIDEETEAEVFGHLSKRLHIIAAPSVSAQDASPKDGWKPIETAPNGERILAYWSNEDSGMETVNWDRQFYVGVDDMPTHWQPLPEPPK